MSIFTLASMSPLEIGLIVVGYIFNGALALFMLMLRRKLQQTDALEGKVEDRDAKINALVDRAVDDKIGALAEMINGLQQRLRDGDAHFQALSDRDHKAELKLAEEVHHLREYILTRCATKESVKELSKEVAALRGDLIRVQENKGAA